jgi:hypothetical protein
MATEITKVIAGMDTHADTHHVAIINEHGKPLADKEFLAVGSGYRKIGTSSPAMLCLSRRH